MQFIAWGMHDSDHYLHVVMEAGLTQEKGALNY